MDKDEIMTVDQLAEFLGVHKLTIKRWREKGELEGIEFFKAVPSSRRIYVTRKSVEAYQKARISHCQEERKQKIDLYA